MKTTQIDNLPRYWSTLTLQTRTYGHTYVHALARKIAPFAHQACKHEGIRFSYSGYGRSLTTAKGHKYKVHARYAATGAPVPSRVLKSI